MSKILKLTNFYSSFLAALWKGLFAWAGLFFVFWLGLFISGKAFVYSDTPSLEQSFFMVEQIKIGENIDTKALKGRIVAVCLDDEQQSIATRNNFNAQKSSLRKWLNCEDGTKSLWLKRVSAVEFDTIEVKNDSVYINDGLVAPLPYRLDKIDKTKKYLYKFNVGSKAIRELKSDEVFLLGDHRFSFDSRYAGVFRTSQIKAIVTMAL